MNDLDDLTHLIHDHLCGCYDTGCYRFGGASFDVASDIVERGYRRTVGLDELETAAHKLRDEFSPFTTVGSLRAMKALARELGLDVT